ncbi:hypothetical protein BCR32DRAFT_277028 [Anaeromyces robustus]|uniref:Uncharacterized protein n=1 Tax=Anaeromyces robustus TaxID=1754192 RepID=A0A1Y1XFJ7_9FUNG|nr:hypothetical protein BCR32DRAFT_277028 [Anaeromyces robustus]|eukprot:ORX84530.1 hypothetical protein BCR32DRAFT_277028 [Anaeromyces robustus]
MDGIIIVEMVIDDVYITSNSDSECFFNKCIDSSNCFFNKESPIEHCNINYKYFVIYEHSYLHGGKNIMDNNVIRNNECSNDYY